MTTADPVLDRILVRAKAEYAVRLVVVTSTRARPEGPADEFSDYDVILALTDLDCFDPTAAYGRPAARWGDEHDVHGTLAFFRGVVYEDGVKIDWTVWPTKVAELIAEHGLNDNLDVGYCVLLDKDGATASWLQPTLRARTSRQSRRRRSTRRSSRSSGGARRTSRRRKLAASCSSHGSCSTPRSSD